MKEIRNPKRKLYLLTGASGFLGNHVCQELVARGEQVRALILPNGRSVDYLPIGTEIFEGDLCDLESMERFFKVEPGCKTVVIHCAGMVTLNPDYDPQVMDVNVDGTKNVVELCLDHAECRKLVYVS